MIYYDIDLLMLSESLRAFQFWSYGPTIDLTIQTKFDCICESYGCIEYRKLELKSLMRQML